MEPNPSSDNLSAYDSRKFSSDTSFIVSPPELTARPSNRFVPVDEPGIHHVVFTVTISVAFPTGPGDDKLEDISCQKSTSQARLSKKIIEAPRDQRFLHCEYSLFPSDLLPVQTDVVLHGRIAAKIFTDQLDAKIVQTWNHNDMTWVSWSSRHSVSVSEAMLTELVNHSLVVRLWDDKERLSPRAKFDKPKAFKFSNEKSDDAVYGGSGVRPAVLKQCDNYLSHQPKRFMKEKTKIIKETKICHTLPTIVVAGCDPKIRRLLDMLRTFEVPIVSSINNIKSPIAGDKQHASGVGDTAESKKAGVDKKEKKTDDVEICQVIVPFSKLFAGVTTLTDRLITPVESFGDAFVSVSLSEPLLSPIQVEKHNPLVIHIHSATKMPTTPVPLNDIIARCQPAYIKYNILDLPEHRSIGLTQSRSLYWDDINVILTGSIDRCRLREFFAGQPFEVQVHDRDRKIHQFEEASSLFGEEQDDPSFGSIAPLPVTASQFSSWDPYGSSKFDLSELLLGQTMLQLRSPILNCAMPQNYVVPPVGCDGRLVTLPSTTGGPVEPPLRPGDYLESDASLKIVIRLAYPLTDPCKLVQHITSEPSAQCPFGRLVFKFSFCNVDFLSTLTSLVSSVNARSLELDSLPSHIVRSALATYKLTKEQRQNCDLDIVTGFHLSDGGLHLIVLEGLCNGAVKQIAETLSNNLPSDVTMLYHSNLTFHCRLYDAFDVELYNVYLEDLLSTTLCSPIIFLRELAPCLSALTQLQLLSQLTKLRDAVRNDAFPTAESLVCVSREFGVPVQADHFEAVKAVGAGDSATGDAGSTSDMQRMDSLGVKSSPSETEEKCANCSSSVTLQESPRDIILQNKINVSNLSETVRLNRCQSAPQFIEAPTTEMAFAKLQSYLHKHDPRHLYTFCNDFHHSMTVPRSSVKQATKEEAKLSRDRWLTCDGWLNRGRITWELWNRHHQALDETRIEELAIPLDELYTLPPNVTRKPFPWSLRNLDMNTWSKPPPCANPISALTDRGPRPPTTECRLPRTQVHRVAVETELTERGPLSSNQLDKLHGILKDAPCRYLLCRYPVNTPALSVVHYPNLESQCASGTSKTVLDEYYKGYSPGPQTQRGLGVKGNHIPVADYERRKFACQHGQDFNVYCRQYSKLHNRRSAPLSKYESTEYRSTTAVGGSLKPMKLPCPPQSHVCHDVVNVDDKFEYQQHQPV